MAFQNPETSLGNIEEIEIGLSWDMFDKNSAVDLDASCVFFDSFGRIVDAVFYNQLDIGYAIHSGDNKTGEGEGYDETIRVKLTKMKRSINSFMVVINAYTGGNFCNVETAQATIVDSSSGNTLAEISVGCAGSHTALVLCCVYKKPDVVGWTMRHINKIANGKNFQEVEKEMKEELGRFLIDLNLAEEMVWDKDNQKSFNMKKGDVVQLRNLNSMKMGLGWDTHCDLDASVIEISSELKIASTVMYSRKQNDNNSIRHSGDNTTGAGSGDDETIIVDLDKVDRETAFLVCLVNVFTSGKTFGEVKGAYCRLLTNGKVVCRYNLTDQKDGDAMMMCLIYRNGPADWKIKALGEKTTGRNATKSEMDVLRFVKQTKECKGLLVKMAEEKIVGLERELEVLKLKAIGMDERVDELQLEIEQTPDSLLIPNKIRMQCSAKKVDKMDLIGKSDPYYLLKNEAGLELFKSEIIKVTLDPVWKSHMVDLMEFNTSKVHRIEVFDWDKHSSDDFIGSFEFVPQEVADGKNSYDLINPKKQKKKKKYTNSGVFTFDQFEMKVYETNEEYKSLTKELDSIKSDRVFLRAVKIENKKKEIAKWEKYF